LVATEVFLAARVFFLVTPTGLLALVVVVFLVLFAPVLAVAFFFVTGDVPVMIGRKARALSVRIGGEREHESTRCNEAKLSQ
jgi:hypothetical protein